eukprot:gene25050-biopygen8984
MTEHPNVNVGMSATPNGGVVMDGGLKQGDGGDVPGDSYASNTMCCESESFPSQIFPAVQPVFPQSSATRTAQCRRIALDHAGVATCRRIPPQGPEWIGWTRNRDGRSGKTFLSRARAKAAQQGNAKEKEKRKKRKGDFQPGQ